MPRNPPKRIRVSLHVSGAGPGMEGSSAIEFRRSESGWAGWACGSALDKPEELGHLPPDAGWRDRVQFIIDIGQPSHEDHDPTDVKVTGARGSEADLLALAWSGPQGTDAARVLLDLSHEELAQLQNAGAIRDAECAEAIQSLNELLETETEVLALIRSVLENGSFSWSNVSAQAEERVTEQELEDEKRAEERETALRPFAADIDRCIRAWESSVGQPSGSISMLGHSARRSALRSYLEDHTLQHGHLPTGRHHVPASIMGNRLDFDVDLDGWNRT